VVEATSKAIASHTETVEEAIVAKATITTTTSPTEAGEEAVAVVEGMAVGTGAVEGGATTSSSTLTPTSARAVSSHSSLEVVEEGIDLEPAVVVVVRATGRGSERKEDAERAGDWLFVDWVLPCSVL